MARASYRDSRFTCNRGGDGVLVSQTLTARGAASGMTFSVHMTVRGIERSKDQILRRISTGRVGKRWKVDSVDITVIDASRKTAWIEWSFFVRRCVATICKVYRFDFVSRQTQIDVIGVLVSQRRRYENNIGWWESTCFNAVN